MTVEPAEPAFRSSAELDVWQVLRANLGPDDVLLANLRLTDHAGDHEGDIIVGLRGAGIAVIEVKGGRVTHNGTDWVQHGSVSKPIDPVGQARRGKYSLRSYLDSRDAWDRRRVRMAHLVAFPYSTIPRDLSLPECPRWIILDKNDLSAQPLEIIRSALVNQETDNPPATVDDLSALVRCLRPAIDVPTGATTKDSHSPHRARHWAWVAAALIAAVVIIATAGTYMFRSQRASSTPVSGDTDPRFVTCLQAKAAGYGHYHQGQDPEYAWYRDLDGDGVVCE
ncbi:MAG: NERD domain-containing protein [Actinobacteria bacterium]|nr:NERD domain-containing protein [Actinomycetota bacterium]